MKIGYIIVSGEVMRDGKRIGYLYREEPDNEKDSGWRVFSGEETQGYADISSNFSMHNATTVVNRDPAVAPLLARAFPVAFERNPDTGEFVEVEVEEE